MSVAKFHNLITKAMHVSMNMKLRLMHYVASNEVFPGYELHNGGMSIWCYESYLLNPKVHYHIHKRQHW